MIIYDNHGNSIVMVTPWVTHSRYHVWDTSILPLAPHCQGSAFHDRTTEAVSPRRTVAPTLQVPPVVGIWRAALHVLVMILGRSDKETKVFEPSTSRYQGVLLKTRSQGNEYVGYVSVYVIKFSLSHLINKEFYKNWTPILSIARGATSSPPRCKTSTVSAPTSPTSPTSAAVSVTISTSVSSCFRFLELWHTFSRELYETDAASIISSYAKWGQCCRSKDANFIKPAELPPDSMKDTSSPLKAVPPKPNALRHASATRPTGPTPGETKSKDAESFWATASRSILPPEFRKQQCFVNGVNGDSWPIHMAWRFQPQITAILTFSFGMFVALSCSLWGCLFTVCVTHILKPWAFVDD